MYSVYIPVVSLPQFPVAVDLHAIDPSLPYDTTTLLLLLLQSRVIERKLRFYRSCDFYDFFMVA